MHTADSPTFWSGLAIVVLASVACGLIAALAFVVLAFTSPKIHQSTAVIEISPPFQFQSLQSTNSPKSVAPDLETQARIVVSRDFATRVVRYLNLETREDFLKGLNSTSRDTVELLKSCVSATPIRNSNLISITAQHPNPNMAADIANAFSQYYVRYTAEKEGAIQFAAVKWLKDQVEEQRKKTEGSRTALDSARATLATVSGPDARVEAEKTVQECERDFKVNESLLTSLTENLKKLEIKTSLNANQILILEKATPGLKPVFPLNPGRLSLVSGIAALVGLLAGILIAGARESMLRKSL